MRVAVHRRRSIALGLYMFTLCLVGRKKRIAACLPKLEKLNACRVTLG